MEINGFIYSKILINKKIDLVFHNKNVVCKCS